LSRTRNDVLISAFVVFLLLGVVWGAREWPFRTRLFPWVIGFPVLVLALVQLGLAIWQALRQRVDREVDGIDGELGEEADGGAMLEPRLSRQRTLSISAWTLAFALGFWLFGFKVGSLLLSFAFLRFQANESWKVSVLYGLGIYLFFFLCFEIALGVPVAPGVIAASLELQSFDWYLVNPLLNVILRR